MYAIRPILLLCFVVLFGCRSAEEDFEKARAANTEQAYRDFINDHSSHQLAEEAKKSLELVAFEAAITSNEEEVLERYLKEFQDSLHVKQVKSRLRKLLWPKLPSTESASGATINYTVRSLVLGGVKDGFGRLLWGDMTVQPEDGKAMDVSPKSEEGTLLGYTFNIDQLRLLKAKERIALYDAESWHVVTIAVPLQEDIIGIEGYEATITSPDGKKSTVLVKQLRLIDQDEGRAGLVWDLRAQS